MYSVLHRFKLAYCEQLVFHSLVLPGISIFRARQCLVLYIHDCIYIYGVLCRLKLACYGQLIFHSLVLPRISLF